MSIESDLCPQGPIDPRVPGCRLYSVPGVAIATLMGSLICGLLLLAQNRTKTGDTEAARATALLGLGCGVNWRAAGVGLSLGLLLIGSLFGVVLLAP
jgi:hypothetical protein